MTNGMDGGIFEDMEQIEHIVDMGFNPVVLKTLWLAIKDNPRIDPLQKELLFEKYTFQMLNRCYDRWMKT